VDLVSLPANWMDSEKAAGLSAAFFLVSFGKWQVASGEWEVVSREWGIGNRKALLPLATSHSPLPTHLSHLIIKTL
jgi:hypothetical protein